MTPTSYNVSVAAGLAMVAVGAGVQWGWPIGAVACGLLVIALSVVGLVLAVR